MNALGQMLDEAVELVEGCHGCHLLGEMGEGACEGGRMRGQALANCENGAGSLGAAADTGSCPDRGKMLAGPSKAPRYRRRCRRSSRAARRWGCSPAGAARR